jgi:hypothetical protein
MHTDLSPLSIDMVSPAVPSGKSGCQLIAQSDTVVFVLSPKSASSVYCKWEVEETDRLRKRIIPIICVALGDANVPQRLKNLNYIFFYPEPKVPGSGFGAGLKNLVTTLKLDPDWERDQTRFGELAASWEGGGRSVNRLLSGSDIAQAKDWLARHPREMPEPSDLVRNYIRASEEEEKRRTSEERLRLAERERLVQEAEAAVGKLSRRTMIGLAGAGGLTMIAAGLAYWGVNAEGRFRREQERVARAGKEALDAAINEQAMRPNIEGVLTVFALEPTPDRESGRQGSVLSQSLLQAALDRDASVEQVVRTARDEVLGSAPDSSVRPVIVTDLNAAIFLRRHPPDRKRYALVIGNSQYRSAASLMWPNYDAHSWAKFFEQEGFEVSLLTDAGREDIFKAFEAVLQNMNSGSKNQAPPLATARHDSRASNPLFVMYYAGHGVQRGTVNFLVPVDVDIKRPETRLISVDELTKRARISKGASIIIVNTQSASGTLGGR